MTDRSSEGKRQDSMKGGRKKHRSAKRIKQLCKALILEFVLNYGLQQKQARKNTAEAFRSIHSTTDTHAGFYKIPQWQLFHL